MYPSLYSRQNSVHPISYGQGWLTSTEFAYIALTDNYSFKSADIRKILDNFLTKPDPYNPQSTIGMDVRKTVWTSG